MVRSARRARLEPWAAGHRSHPWPVLPPSPFGLRRTSRDGASRIVGTRMAGFPANNRESAGPQVSSGTGSQPVARMERSEIREDGPGFRCAPSGLRSHIAPPQGRIPCKQQRIYNPFTSVVARAGATRASTNEKSRSEAAHPVALSVARHMRPSCKGPTLWAPGAIPTVDFLLYGFGAVVKKMGVKSHDGAGDDLNGH